MTYHVSSLVIHLRAQFHFSLYGHVHSDLATCVDPIFNCFMGVWDPSNQLEAELASNLPRVICKMVECDINFANFRFLAEPSASGHGEYIYIYIYIHI